MDEAKKKAQENISSAGNESEMFYAYLTRELARLDFNSSVSTARKKGIAIGIQKGIQKGIQEGIQEGFAIGMQKEQQKFVLRLSQKGLSVVEISEWMDLPVEEIEKILNC
ncbi:MAG: hypothetical protein LBR26_10655 [Prevotella sp.]|nr:hypothetical protein [Prevotella sp.]